LKSSLRRGPVRGQAHPHRRREASRSGSGAAARLCGRCPVGVTALAARRHGTDQDAKTRTTWNATSAWSLTPSCANCVAVNNETDDGLSGKEGTFLICSFWLVSALAIVGEMRQAKDMLETPAQDPSLLGLYAEEFDVVAARHLGNFPQALLPSGVDRGRRPDHRGRADRGDVAVSQHLSALSEETSRPNWSAAR